jgi:hypothetical protein
MLRDPKNCFPVDSCLLVTPALAPSCPGGAACSPIPAGHAVEVVLLRLEPREEAVRNEAARAGGHVEGRKAGQRLAASHAGDTAALQLLLPQQSTDLTAVHLRTKQRTPPTSEGEAARISGRKPSFFSGK